MIPRARDFRSFEFILYTVYRQLSLAIDSGCRIRPEHIALGRFDFAPANSVYRAGDERRMGCLAFVAITPVARWALIARGTAYSNRFPVPSSGGLPHPIARSASALVVSRYAQRSRRRPTTAIIAVPQPPTQPYSEKGLKLGRDLAALWEPEGAIAGASRLANGL
jgi:hypothetical protein